MVGRYLLKAMIDHVNHRVLDKQTGKGLPGISQAEGRGNQAREIKRGQFRFWSNVLVRRELLGIYGMQLV